GARRRLPGADWSGVFHSERNTATSCRGPVAERETTVFSRTGRSCGRRREPGPTTRGHPVATGCADVARARWILISPMWRLVSNPRNRLAKTRTLIYILLEACRTKFGRSEHSLPDSSTVEQPAVNRFVVGSNPTRGA